MKLSRGSISGDFFFFFFPLKTSLIFLFNSSWNFRVLKSGNSPQSICKQHILTYKLNKHKEMTIQQPWNIWIEWLSSRLFLSLKNLYLSLKFQVVQRNVFWCCQLDSLHFLLYNPCDTQKCVLMSNEIACWLHLTHMILQHNKFSNKNTAKQVKITQRTLQLQIWIIQI